MLVQLLNAGQGYTPTGAGRRGRAHDVSAPWSVPSGVRSWHFKPGDDVCRLIKGSCAGPAGRAARRRAIGCLTWRWSGRCAELLVEFAGVAPRVGPSNHPTAAEKIGHFSARTRTGPGPGAGVPDERCRRAERPGVAPSGPAQGRDRSCGTRRAVVGGSKMLTSVRRCHRRGEHLRLESSLSKPRLRLCMPSARPDRRTDGPVGSDRQGSRRRCQASGSGGSVVGGPPGGAGKSIGPSSIVPRGHRRGRWCLARSRVSTGPRCHRVHGGGHDRCRSRRGRVGAMPAWEGRMPLYRRLRAGAGGGLRRLRRGAAWSQYPGLPRSRRPEKNLQEAVVLVIQ